MRKPFSSSPLCATWRAIAHAPDRSLSPSQLPVFGPASDGDSRTYETFRAKLPHESDTTSFCAYVVTTRRIIEMQVFIAELFGDFQVALPSEEVVIKRAPAGIIMLPVVAGKEDELSVAMPLRLSLVQP